MRVLLLRRDQRRGIVDRRAFRKLGDTVLKNVGSRDQPMIQKDAMFLHGSRCMAQASLRSFAQQESKYGIPKRHVRVFGCGTLGPVNTIPETRLP
jgi:hypothetical protein